MKIWLIPASALLLAACASAPPRESRAVVAAQMAAAGAELPPRADAVVPDAPLEVDAALRIALAQHPQVKAELARLDAARAESLQAGLLANPMAGLMLLRPGGGGRFELQAGFMQTLADWWQRPLRLQQAEAAQQRVEAEVLASLLDLSQTVQRAHHEAVAAEQRLGLLEQQVSLDVRAVQLAEARAASGIGGRDAVLARSGELDRRRAELARARADRASSRAELAAAMGLDSSAALQLPATLPAFAMPGLERWPLPNPELQAAEAAQAEAAAARQLAGSASGRWQPRLGLTGMRGSEGMKAGGPELQLELPLLDRGQARIAAADAALMEAGHRAEAARRAARLQIERALDRLRQLQAQVEHAAALASAAAKRQALRETNWQAGLVGWDDYREARAAALDARLALQEAELQRQLAALDLARALGRAVWP